MVRRRQQVRAKHGPMTGSAPSRANGDGTRRVSNPEIFLFCKMAHPTRFERVTFAFGGQRSIQLSYGCVGVHLAHWPGLGNGQVGSFFGKGHAFESCRVRQEAVCGACRDCGDPLLPRQKSAETAAKESLWSTRPTRRLCFKAVAHLFASLSGRWLRGPWSGESRKFYPDRTDPLLGFGILEPISSNMRSKIKAPVSLIKVDARFSSCFPVSSSPAVPDRIRRSACTIRARHSGTRA